MSNLKAYLAQKYMSGPKADAILSKTAPKKHKKRKAQEPLTRAMKIRDEDEGWGKAAKEEDDISEAEQPVVVNSVPVRAGGLMKPAELNKMLPQNNVADLANNMTEEEISRAQETVYRDSSGRKIDTKIAKAEAARLKREREEKEAQKMEWGKGLVQRGDEENKRRELEKQKTTAFARHADDKELNEEQRAKNRWNDPAAAFLTNKKSKGPRRPEYTGPPPPPNRFGIKPGHRWDGVDRSNGFEKKYFQSLNSKKRRGAESYQWSVDDM